MTTKPRGRPRSESTRQAVLAAAARLLLAEGFDRLSLEGIAAEAGTSRQTLYRWWTSKAAIVCEAILETELALPIYLVEDTGDLRHDLSAWMQKVTALYVDGAGGIVRASAQISAEDPDMAAVFIDRVNRPVFESIVARLNSGADRGEVRPGIDATAFAETLFGFGLYVSFTPGAAQRAEVVLDLVLEGVRPR